MFLFVWGVKLIPHRGRERVAVVVVVAADDANVVAAIAAAVIATAITFLVRT